MTAADRPHPAPATAAAFADLLALVADAPRHFLPGGRAPGDETTTVEGYLWLLQLLAVAGETYVWADPARPEMTPIVSPTMKWGGDNADAYYHYAALDPQRRYRLTGRRGDAAYLSVTVYGGPDDGRWSTRIVGTRNDRDLAVGGDGAFSLVLSPDPPEGGGDWLQLEPDAVALLTRDYLVDPVAGRRATWHIEALDPAPPPRPSDADAARRLRAAATFLTELFGIFPLAPDPDPAAANTVAEPYPVPEATYGWAAGDAAYALGRYDLADDEALVVEGRSPECAFWNLCLWNPYLQTYDYRYERVTINGGQTVHEPDGSWRLVVAARDPGIPNWLSTAGRPRGLLWFRWFLPAATPERPTTRVVSLADLAGS
jgi:hypothetical protein